MTNEFKALMQLVGAAAQGKAVSGLPDDLDWQKIERLADEQAVQTLLGYALKLSPGLACPEELRKRLVGQMRQLAFSNNAWKVSILRLIQQMNDAGIPALLIKGYAVADCYAAPDCRMSGDTDLLIEPKNEKRACAFMKANDFAVERRWTNGHHDVCQHPQMGCVELHVMLYDEIVEDVWFGRMDGREFVCEPPIEAETPDGCYRTLGYTDHMIFLMLHLIKHFIMTGMSLRMMLDVALFFSHHAGRIDSARFWKTMESLKYGTIAQSILWAMVRYCGIDATSIPGLCEACPKQVGMYDLGRSGKRRLAGQNRRESSGGRLVRIQPTAAHEESKQGAVPAFYASLENRCVSKGTVSIPENTGDSVSLRAKKRDCDSFCMGASTDIPRKPSGEKGSVDYLYRNG